ncbi:Zinc finger CCCH domain-containing protein 24 [Acorus calamus]|uniref:Zinc finger CCCH domain-containing protein 24 n=1 Tax=Acorus calamus TaxID=4465 RepID=A0AAV9E6H9_ACOCL|nr:Zinc finger CCCH domain-containing protein 24 [Acorus calamus]
MSSPNPPTANDGIQLLDAQNVVSSIDNSSAGVVIRPCDAKSIAEVATSEKRKREDEVNEVEAGVVPPPPQTQHQNPMWKTSLCSYFRRHNKSCSHGDSCRYAHGEAELRPRPDNSWDPTSERAKKLLKTSDNIEGDVPSEASDGESDLPPCDDVNSSLSKCLVGLPRKWASETLKNFLDKEGIVYKSSKKKKGMTVGFISFDTLEQLKNGTNELKGKLVGSKQIKIADVIVRSHDKKQKERGGKQFGEDPDSSCDPLNNDYDLEKDGSVVDGLALKRQSARNAVTPLAHMSYKDQLEHKKNLLLQTLKRLTRNARKACPDGAPLPEWILKSREIGGLPCQLEGIIESPLVNGYRNKCEFSVGYSLQGKRTVGFQLGNFREGMTAVEEPLDCPNVSRIACKYAMVFQEFLQSSTLPVWNRIENSGFWRQLTVREGRRPGQVCEVENGEANIAEVMLIVQICASGIEEELAKEEFRRMAQAFLDGARACSPPLPLSALVVQDHRGISNAAPADCPLLPLVIPELEKVSSQDSLECSDPIIHDYISNLQFCVSPTAFFQVNTLAAEKLYSLAGDWANLDSDTLLFDICCGTGTIGLTLAHRVGMVVGIEMNESAVSDARKNAEINGIKNCRFICGKAEAVMGSLLKEYLNMPNQHDTSSDISEIRDSKSTKENESLNDNIDFDIKSHTEDEVATDAATRSSDQCDVTLGETCVPEVHLDGKISQTESLDNEKGNSFGCTGNFKGTCELNSDVEEDKGKTTPAFVGQFKNIVAIVDPPRVGLHPIVIKTLRTHPRLRRLVYISCKPESLVGNAIELCTPSADKPDKNKNNRGWRSMSATGLARHRMKSMPNSEPFKPVRVMAVDLFPHTSHCEMVMLLER